MKHVLTCAVYAAGISVAASPVGIALAAEGGVQARQAASAALGISGVWWTKTYSAKAQPVDGGAVPLTPAGQKAYEKNKAAIRNAAAAEPTACVPEGVPRSMATPYPFEIVQAQGQIILDNEANHNWRVAVVGGSHPAPDDLQPFFNGDETATWDGQTLVIDTVSVNPRTFLDSTGLPHGEGMHVIERLALLDGGEELEDVITIDDPEMYAKPWRLRYVYEKRPDVQIEQYVCGDQHRDLSGVTVKPANISLKRDLRWYMGAMVIPAAE